MIEQPSDPDESQAIADATDIDGSIRGLQAVVSRKENERQAALRELETLRAENEELRSRVGPAPDPIIDRNRARPMRFEPDPYADLRNVTWEQMHKG